MAELVVEGKQLVLRLSWWEKIAAVHGNVRVPLSSVNSVRVETHPADYKKRPSFRASYGPSSLHVPYGYRRNTFIAVPRWRPAVHVSVDDPKYRLIALLVSVADPEVTAARIMDAKFGHQGTEGKR